MKKVLVIVPYAYLPVESGGQKYIAQFLDNLGKETALTVIGVPENDSHPAINYKLLPLLKKSFTRYFDLSLVKKISLEIKSGNYDSVIWEHPYFGWLASIVKKRTGIRTILHTHNIEYQRFRSVGKWWWTLLRVYEKWCFKKADHIFFITPEDRAFAINDWKIESTKCSDLPFGITIDKFPADKASCKKEIQSRHNIADDDKIILFNGVLDYKPNTDALKVILNDINPLLLKQESFRYKIIICGKNLPAEFDSLKIYAGQNIIYAGFVNDIELYFKGADIFLNPVQSGGGVKTKMVEAIAFGTTVISTKTGAAGIRKEVCGDKLITVDDNDWSNMTANAIANAVITTQTPGAFYSYYNWENVIKNILSSLTN